VDPLVPAADLEIGHSSAMMDSALTNGTQVAWTTGTHGAMAAAATAWGVC
jgi:hypothetical protein